jgi:hypothetical protein
MRIIRSEARKQRVVVTESEGGSHTKLTVGNTVLRIPRHSVLNMVTARAILSSLDKEFGKGWSKI